MIQEVAAADLVLASSLHALVVAHALGVPACFVSNGATDEPVFKYRDYYSVFGLEPTRVRTGQPIDQLMSAARHAAESEWEPIQAALGGIIDRLGASARLISTG